MKRVHQNPDWCVKGQLDSFVGLSRISNMMEKVDCSVAYDRMATDSLCMMNYMLVVPTDFPFDGG